jgi:HD-GYP domain-containing protein (c-di-GMP phosphodiesterase class II)
MFAELCDLFLTKNSSGQAKTRLAHWWIVASRMTDLAEGRPLRHSMRVAMIAYYLATTAKLSPVIIQTTVQAALLHDVGILPLLPKLATHLPPVLNEKQLLSGHRAWQHGLVTWNVGLSEEARYHLEQHPLQAKSLLAHWRVEPDVIATIMASHELWNGQGYPLGLAKEAIPLAAQLVAMADLLEGLMTPNLTPAQREQAVRSVLNGPAAVQWNPELLALVNGPFFENPWWSRELFATEADIFALLPQETLHPSQLISYTQQAATWVEATGPEGMLGHSHRVATYAQRTAQALGVNADQQGQLILAGLWHEVGKIAWPMAMWHKREPFNQGDWQIAHHYPKLGAEVLHALPGCDDVTTWLGEIHERMNGSGYPGGLKGQHISLGARLLALCDAFDAMTSHRPYRSHAYGTTDALSLLAEQRNRLFDGQLFNVFRQVVLDHTTVYSQLLTEV